MAAPLRRSLLSAALLLLSASACREPGPPVMPEDVRVRVGMVGLDNNHVPVVILEEEDGDRWLPIWIGSFEARSIASEMDHETPARPNTHDLAHSLIAQLEGEVESVVVTELRGGTYYAVLSLRTRSGVLELDSRPSDAIAIALRAGAPIFVRAPVFAAAGEGRDSESAGRRIQWRAPGSQLPGTAAATPQLGL
jgi:bifunctional DNase/RNase